MVSIKRAFSLVLTATFSIFLFAIEPNLILSKSFSKIINFNIDLNFENLSVENIYGDEILVELYSNNNKKLPQLSNDEGTIFLKTKQTKLYPSDYCNVKIYIPYEAVFENVKIQTSSGNITLQNISAEELTIKTASGKIKTQELKISSYINLSSISGQIDINSAITETISAQNSSASIYISCLQTDYFDANTESGDVDLVLENPPKASSRINSKTGQIQISLLNKTGFDFIASSTSGTLRDDISNLRLSPRNEFRNSYFGGGPEIQIRTNSGNITLK